MVKCSAFGVIDPLSDWCGVRACWVLASPLGLLRMRTTFFSYFDGVCSTGVISPGSRPHSGSVSGSAAALVSDGAGAHRGAGEGEAAAKQRAAVDKAVAGHVFERRRSAAAFFANAHGSLHILDGRLTAP